MAAPTTMSVLLTAATLAASSRVHTVIVTPSGVFAMGQCSMLGRSACTSATAHVPALVPLPVAATSTNVAAVAVSDSVSAVVVNGALYVWGPCARLDGQLNVLLVLCKPHRGLPQAASSKPCLRSCDPIACAFLVGTQYRPPPLPPTAFFFVCLWCHRASPRVC